MAGAVIGTPADAVSGPVGTVGGAIVDSIAGGVAGSFTGNSVATLIFGP